MRRKNIKGTLLKCRHFRNRKLALDFGDISSYNGMKSGILSSYGSVNWTKSITLNHIRGLESVQKQITEEFICEKLLEIWVNTTGVYGLPCLGTFSFYCASCSLVTKARLGRVCSMLREIAWEWGQNS